MPTRYRLKHHQLAAELAKKRHSQNRWADVLGVGRAHLSLLVNGKRPYPSEDTRRKLLQGLDVPFSTLFEIEDVPMPGSDRPRHHAWMPRPEPPGIVMPFESTFQEIRYALRAIALRPMFSLVVIAMLALGIAGNSAMFSWLDGILLRPLQVEHPDRWVALGIQNPSGFVASYSYPNFVDHLEMNDAFEEMFAARVFPVSFSSGGENTRANASMVNGAYFRALGGAAELGRTFNESEDRVPGSETVAVISHGFWQRHFAGDPDVVGTEVLINSRPFVIIGVMPERFGFARAEVTADLWAPLVMQEVLRPGSATIECRGCGFLQVFGRAKPGLTLAQVDTQINDTHSRLVEEYPEDLRGTRVSVRPATRAYLGPAGDAIAAVFAVLMGVIGAVLLIACINVANLMLARGADRSGEMAVRMALGASRRRIVKQLLTESLILSGAAAILGVILAGWLNNLILSFQPPSSTPLSILVGLDGRALAFTSLIAIATGLIFGTVPALRAAGTNVVGSLHGSGRVASGNRLRNTLVVVQIATSVALLIGAGLFVRSLQNATTIDPGFDSSSTVLATLDPALQGYSLDETRTFYRELVQRLEASPGIGQIAMAEMIPMSLSNQQWGTSVEGYEPAENERMSLDYNYVAPGYFGTMGIELLAGRDFLPEDDADGAGAVIVNETMASRYWPDGRALGGTVRSGGMDRTVVGVVADAKYYTLGEAPMPFMYFPFEQSNQSAMTLHLRAEGDMAAVITAVREEVRRMDAAMPIYDIRSLDAQMSIALLPARMTAALLAAFGGFALLLAAVGLYGVMAYVVGQRTREIGIRMALGAAQDRVLSMVIRSALWLLAIGAGIGLLAGIGLGRVSQGVLYGVGAGDPLALIGALGVIGLTVLVAAWLPARRASRVNPVEALRAD